MDNSFAAKRWTKPDEWTRIIRDMGIRHIEASADTEADPLYCGFEYLSQWLQEVREACAAHGVTVDNFYTGYTTYRTLGLAHPDAKIRARVLNDWLKVQARIAVQISAGLGFYIHAISESTLQNREAYSATIDRLYDALAEISRFAGEQGPVPIVVEQMYSPQQPPWTIEGAFEYLREVSGRSGYPAYIALDTGHHTGQHRFLRPGRRAIERSLAGQGPVPYLGPDTAYALFEETQGRSPAARADAATRIEAEMDRYPYLFAGKKDGDLYGWLGELGCYSPILHLQQNDGRSSSHLPFTAANNEAGIVHPLKVLEAISSSYRAGERAGMPPRCTRICLTFEIFTHTFDRPRDILPGLEESVRYWRQWVPEDGTSLSALLARQSQLS